LKIHFDICVEKIYGFILVKKVVTFGYRVGVSFSWKFKRNFKGILNWSANRK
jgi:hypothetical protein